MGLWNWIKTQATGVDEDAEQERAAWLEPAVDRQAQVSAAKYGDDWLRQYQAHDKLDDVYENGSEFNAGFEEELDRRASALGAAGDKTITKILATMWRAVPLWVWLGLALFAISYFVGWSKLLKKAKA